MSRIIDFYFFALKVTIALLLASMVVLVFGNVVLRYAFNQGITVSEELSRMFFVWLTFLGAVVAMREHGHLGVDSLIKRLPARAAKAAVLCGHALMLYAAWLVISGSWTQTLINLHVGAPATGISMAFYGAGPRLRHSGLPDPARRCVRDRDRPHRRDHDRSRARERGRSSARQPPCPALGPLSAKH